MTPKDVADRISGLVCNAPIDRNQLLVDLSELARDVRASTTWPDDAAAGIDRQLAELEKARLIHNGQAETICRMAFRMDAIAEEHRAQVAKLEADLVGLRDARDYFRFVVDDVRSRNARLREEAEDLKEELDRERVSRGESYFTSPTIGCVSDDARAVIQESAGKLKPAMVALIVEDPEQTALSSLAILSESTKANPDQRITAAALILEHIRHIKDNR